MDMLGAVEAETPCRCDVGLKKDLSEGGEMPLFSYTGLKSCSAKGFQHSEAYLRATQNIEWEKVTYKLISVTSRELKVVERGLPTLLLSICIRQ